MRYCTCVRDSQDCVAHFHKRGFVHRDIKPSNFMRPRASGDAAKAINEDGVYILDFGLSRTFKDSKGGMKEARLESGSHLSINQPILVQDKSLFRLGKYKIMLLYYIANSTNIHSKFPAFITFKHTGVELMKFAGF